MITITRRAPLAGGTTSLATIAGLAAWPRTAVANDNGSFIDFLAETYHQAQARYMNALSSPHCSDHEADALRRPVQDAYETLMRQPPSDLRALAVKASTYRKEALPDLRDDVRCHDLEMLLADIERLAGGAS